MDSLNWWTNFRQSRIILRKERTHSPSFCKLWNRSTWILLQFWFKLTALERDTLKLIREMVESTMTYTCSWQFWFQKNNILKKVWATNNWSTLLDRARRVVLEKVSPRIRCQLPLLLFDNSCRKCESRWYWPRSRFKKVKTLVLRKKAFQKNWNAF